MAKQTDNQVSAVRRAKHGWILTLFFSILAEIGRASCRERVCQYV